VSFASAREGASSVDEAKKELLRAVAGTRRAPRTATAADVLRAVAEVERASSNAMLASIDGDWTLAYSAKDTDSAFGGIAFGEDVVNAITSALYATFFKFAPLLAGSAETNQRGVRNAQSVDCVRGVVRNEVDVDVASTPLASASVSAIRVGVDGEIKAFDRDGRTVEVTFTSFDIGLVSNAGASADERRVKFPLPRPKGILDTTFCDESMRISRGGRGGVFVLTRV